MEEETQIGSLEAQAPKETHDAGNDFDTRTLSFVGREIDIATNGATNQTKKERTTEEAEETALDGEFIKVEKESVSVNDSSHATEPAAKVVADSITEQSSIDIMASRRDIEHNERMKALELELEKLANELQHSENEKAQLKRDINATKEKLEEKAKQCEDLELYQKRLMEQVDESKEKNILHLEALQEALGAQEAKHKELIDIKGAFDGLNFELESSRKKMQDLEQELQSSASDARKFEELRRQSGSQAELEAKKALEFEKMLEFAKSSAKEMENQMTCLREELKGFHEKITESQKTEEAFTSTSAELSMAQAELELSKSQILNMEEQVSSTGIIIDELTQELSMRKASEMKMKDDIIILEKLLSSANEDLQMKISSLEAVELKLKEEVKAKEAVESILKSLEEEISSTRGELAEVMKEKNTLEASVADLNNNIFQIKDSCCDLETKLKLSDDNFCKADSLLSKALAHNAELEEKLKVLETLHLESRAAAATAEQRNLDLEDTFQASCVAEAEAKLQLREIEMQLVSVEQTKIELEQQLTLAEMKNKDADRELKEYSVKTSELMAMLKQFEEETAQWKLEMNKYEEKITQLESNLSLMSLKNLELEQELKDAAKKFDEHEGQAGIVHQRSIELEDLIQISHSKVEEAEKRISDLNQSLECSNSRLKELEEQVVISEKRCQDAEAGSKEYLDRVSKLAEELEVFRVKSFYLENELDSAFQKEKRLSESLKIANEECGKHEYAAKNYSEKLSEAESIMEAVQSELRSAYQKLESMELHLKDAGIREGEIIEKLKFAEQQLEERGQLLKQTTERSSELEFLHESQCKDSEAKLHEAMESFRKRDLEATDLLGKLKAFEDEELIYQEKLVKATETESSLTAKLAESSMKLVSFEEIIDELKNKLVEVELRAEQSVSDNKQLVDRNLNLNNELETRQIKINELQERLGAIQLEKEDINEQLASHMKTVTELMDQHSRDMEFQSAAESRIREAELQLHEANEKFNTRDFYAQELNEKLIALETQVKVSEDHANEAAAAAENRKKELEEALLKLNELEELVGDLQNKASQYKTENEGLSEANLKITREVEVYETNMNDLKAALNASFVEREEIMGQLNSSKTLTNDLTQQLVAEGQKLQTQITSLMEENALLVKTYQEAKEELQAVKVQLESQLNEHKEREIFLNAEVEKLKVELAGKTGLQAHITELEEQLMLAKTHSKEEVESLVAHAAEKERGLVHQLEEHSSKLQEIDVLREKVFLLQRELNLANTTIDEQKKADSGKADEREAVMKLLREEIVAKEQRCGLLAKQVEELEQKLQLAEAKYNEKDVEDKKQVALLNTELEDLKYKLSQNANSEIKIMELENQLKVGRPKSEDPAKRVQTESKDGVEVTTRDLGSLSSTSRRKSKKRTEAMSTQSSESSARVTQTTKEETLGTSLKFILGVGIVSVIIGVILGKRF